jgi:hypothetical protein
LSSSLPIKVSPRAAAQIETAASWWEKNRPAAPGAIRDEPPVIQQRRYHWLIALQWLHADFLSSFWRVACLPAFLPDQGIAPSMKDGEDNDLSSFDAVEH